MINTISPFICSTFSISCLAVPLMHSSCIFVISLTNTICLLFNAKSKSSNVFFNLCGASYKIDVFFNFLISSNLSFLFFLFIGKKPKNVN